MHSIYHEKSQYTRTRNERKGKVLGFIRNELLRRLDQHHDILLNDQYGWAENADFTRLGNIRRMYARRRDFIKTTPRPDLVPLSFVNPDVLDVRLSRPENKERQVALALSGGPNSEEHQGETSQDSNPKARDLGPTPSE